MCQFFQEGRVRFEFPENWKVLRAGTSSYYTKHFQKLAGGCKEMDFLLYDPTNSTLWLLEVKDYQTNRRTKTQELWDEVAVKSRDSLALLMAGLVKDNGDPPEVLEFTQKAQRARKIRIALHLDQPSSPSALFPQVSSLANIVQKLRSPSCLGAIDKKALVTSCDDNSPPSAWQATWNPNTSHQ